MGRVYTVVIDNCSDCYHCDYTETCIHYCRELQMPVAKDGIDKACPLPKYAGAATDSKVI